MLEGYDFSDARPGGAAIATAGRKFVVRYLSNLAKGLTAAEVADYRAHGIAIAVVVEGTAMGALKGYAAGAADAAFAQAKLTALGLGDIPVYFAVDFDVTTDTQYTAIGSYLDGAAGVIGRERVGVYGEYDLMVWCKNNGKACWYWQTYAWSRGRVATFANLVQYSNGHTLNGGAVDYTRAYTTNFGQSVTGEEMPLTPADIGALLNYPAYDGGPSVSQTLKDLHDTLLRPVLRDGVNVSQIQDVANTGTAVREIQQLLETSTPPAGAVDVKALAEQLATLTASRTYTVTPTA